MFGREPVAIATAIRAVILCFVAFGLKWTPEQIAAVMLAVEAVLAVITRQSVTPNANVALTVDKKTPVVLLMAALGSAMFLTGCAGRYKPGTPAQNIFAYELDGALVKIKGFQTTVISAVDSGATSPTIANKFLDPVRDLTMLGRDRIIPLLEAYDAAVKAGDAVKADALHAQIQPLMNEFYAKLGQAFSAPLPDNVIGNLGKLLTQIQETIRTVRQAFAPPVARSSFIAVGAVS